MNHWIEAALITVTALGAAAITMGWIYLWQYLNINRRWSLWICLPAAVTPPILCVYILIATTLT